MSDAPPDSFCLLPWVHAHVDAQGYRRLCCIDSDWFREPMLTLEDHWNGEEMKAVRREMLSGTLPERCSQCSTSLNRVLSYKNATLNKWPEFVEPAIKATAPDGSTAFEPFAFDYRSSTCNLRCRICNPHSSTSAELEAKRHKELRDVGEFVFGGGEEYEKARNGKFTMARDELLRYARDGRIRHLYWAGGEPMMDETHWQVMAELVRSGEAPKVEVSYNTNLTVFSYRGQKVEDIWPHFAQVHIRASVDGVGEAGEYARTGFKTALFARHLDALLDMARRHHHITVALDLTLTSVGLLHLGDFMKFALERKVRVTAKLMVPRDLNRYMAVEFLPRAVKDEWCRTWMSWIEFHDTAGILEILYSTLEVALKHDSLQPADPAPRTHNAYDASVIAAFEKVRHDVGAYRRLLSIDSRLADFIP